MDGTSTAPIPPGDEWQRMHVALSAWKAERHLAQAQAEIRHAESDVTADMRTELYRVDESVSAALASLREVNRFVTKR